MDEGDANGASALKEVGRVVQQYGLTPLMPLLQACEALSSYGGLVDAAVLGQFKSGKSSLLNALLGGPLFPVGALPATAVITRASAGPAIAARARLVSGEVIEVAPGQVADYVTEEGNPGNVRQVAEVDLFTPAMAQLPGLRLVDTPGLGSVHAHNTEATRAWMPNVAAALVAVSAERPLSEQDLALFTEARRVAARVVAVLTKVDLLSEEDLPRVKGFLEARLHQAFRERVEVLPFSTRQDTQRWVSQLREAVLRPLAEDVAGTRRAALKRKLMSLLDSCRAYLEVGLKAAERADADRERLRAAVLNESVSKGLIKDELAQAERWAREGMRASFEKRLFPRRGPVEASISEALAVEVNGWVGSLAERSRKFEEWMASRLREELRPLSEEASKVAEGLMSEAEVRLGRVAEAFRARLAQNVREATGVIIPPARWEGRRPRVDVVPVTVSHAFMLSWEAVSFLVPMGLFAGMFRSHLLGRVPFEVEKNVSRLIADWCQVTSQALESLRGQASAWVDEEIAALERLLSSKAPEAGSFRESLARLEEAGRLAGAS
jgi:GTP-binding protein EngB required for normal cell division